MLCQLSIRNFAIVRSLDLDFKSGMTSITGETGAGKSIAIDALGLCLGNRAEANNVRAEANKAEVSAYFTLDDVPMAQQWLLDNELNNDNANHDCILRRTISNDGRSRAYINGTPVTLQQLKSLGQFLICIHGQHAHHAMLKSEHQLNLLDAYACHQALVTKVNQAFRHYKGMQKELALLQQTAQARIARKQLLQYQVQELDDFALQPEEFEQIEAEHKRLSNSTHLIETCQQAMALLQENEEFNVTSLLNKLLTLCDTLNEYDPNLSSISNMLNEARISVEESANELQHYHSQLELDPQYLQQLENRLSQTLQLARKHQVSAKALTSHHQELKNELASIDIDDEKVQQIEQALLAAKQAYIEQAQILHQSRRQHADKLAKKVTQSINELNMPKGKFAIEMNFNPDTMSPHGSDQLTFKISTNAGQPLQSLAKIASGGELSRIGLGLQVITAQKVATPSLIFDEVDVGISGPTAAIVGKMLRKLGESTQVFCVTHLPQVAGQGHQHYFVNKFIKSGVTETTMEPLASEQRIKELARLLGGNTITENTLANAKELLVA